MKKIGDFWLGIRDFWKKGKTGFALFLLSLSVLIYGYIALDYETTRGWKGHESVQNVLDDISNFIPVWAAVVGMIVGGIDIIMLLSDWYLERREKRVQTAKDEGIAEGQAKVYREVAEWDRRRKAAEARGETFTEPPPAPPEKQSEK